MPKNDTKSRVSAKCAASRERIAFVRTISSMSAIIVTLALFDVVDASEATRRPSLGNWCVFDKTSSIRTVPAVFVLWDAKKLYFGIISCEQ